MSNDEYYNISDLEKAYVAGVKFYALYELKHNQPPRREDTNKEFVKYINSYYLSKD